jgi:hypothetical protein
VQLTPQLIFFLVFYKRSNSLTIEKDRSSTTLTLKDIRARGKIETVMEVLSSSSSLSPRITTYHHHHHHHRRRRRRRRHHHHAS